MSDRSDNPGKRPNQSWLYSNAGQQALGADSISTRETQRANSLNHERNEFIELGTVNIIITDGNIENPREYTFELDASLIPGIVNKEAHRLANS